MDGEQITSFVKRRKEKKMKKFFALFLVVAMVLSFVACTPTEEPTPTQEPAVEGTKEPVDTNVTIRFWQAGGDTADAQATMKSLVEAFTAETGIKVDYQTYPWGANPHTSFQTAIVGGDVADLLIVGSPFDYELALEGQVAPLDEYISEETKADLQGVFASEGVFHGEGELDGKFISMPLYGGTRTIYYNKAIFDAAGVAYPDTSWTMEEFLENSKKLTGEFEIGGEKKTVYGFATSAKYASQYLPFIWNFGGEILTQDNSAAAVNSEEWKAGVEYFLQFFEEGVTPPGSEAMDLAEQLAMFMDDQVAMMCATVDYVTEILKNEGWDAKLGVGAMPNNNGIASSYVGADVFIIPAIAKYPAQAAMLLEYLLRTDSQVKYAQVVGFTPAVKSAMEDPSIANDPVQLAFANALEDGKYYAKVSCSSDITTILRENIQSLLAGNMTLDEYAADAEARINQALAEAE